MLLLVCILIVIGGFFIKDSECKMIVMSIGGILTCIFLAVQMIKYCGHVDDIETIDKCQADRVVYEEKADKLIKQFELYLGKSYPKHEKALFDQMTPEQVVAYALKYPEIRSSETMSKLCDEINHLTTQIYNCDISINHIKRDLTVRQRTMFLFGVPLLPKLE